MFCPHCGSQVAADANFCPNCGAQLATGATVSTYVNPTTTAASTVADDSVMLLSLGSCARATAVSLLQQLCGYSLEEAGLMADSTPIAVAQNLTEAQSTCLAQALSEYGLDVSIYDANGWRDVESQSTSVWDKAGALVAGAASLLGLIGLKNRISRDRMRQWEYPYRFTGTRPPVFRLHNTLIHQTPPPRPRPVIPKPAAPRRSASRPIQPRNTRPAQPRSPGGPGQGGHGGPGGHNAPGGNRGPGGHGGPNRQPR